MIKICLVIIILLFFYFLNLTYFSKFKQHQVVKYDKIISKETLKYFYENFSVKM